MEQTLGKRIAENRKRLGLTQDTLAEKLGITAQAISKWENDQSCPDITMLPRLAEIFGITTDELLGVEPPKQAVPAEAVTEPEGQHNWEFHWDSGRRGTVIFAVMVLAVGMLTFASRVLRWDVSFWSILWPCVLLTVGITNIINGFSAFHLALTCFGGYSLIANLGLWELDIAGELVFPVMLLFFGIGLLVDALKKPCKPVVQISCNGKKRDKGGCFCITEEDSFRCKLSFGENHHRVVSGMLRGGTAEVSFGALQVDLTGCENVEPDCRIDAHCSFGELEVLVPRHFRVECGTRSNAFGNIEIKGHPDPEPAGIISLDANVSFGEVTVCYV